MQHSLFWLWCWSWHGPIMMTTLSSSVPVWQGIWLKKHDSGPPGPQSLWEVRKPESYTPKRTEKRGPSLPRSPSLSQLNPQCSKILCSQFSSQTPRRRRGAYGARFCWIALINFTTLPPPKKKKRIKPFICLLHDYWWITFSHSCHCWFPDPDGLVHPLTVSQNKPILL